VVEQNLSSEEIPNNNKKNPFHLVELSGNEVFLEGLLLTSA
jgi:hypothetical protein